MTLRNKDGSVYKLVGPNPVMKTQNLWGEYTLHNMEYDTEKASDETKINPISSDLGIRDSFISDLERTKQDIKIVETKPWPEKQPEIKPEIKVVENKPNDEPLVDRSTIVQPDPDKQEISEKSHDIEKIFIHVLPATIREKKDSLYGDTYRTIQYEKPTSFEGVILTQEDLLFEVWTDVANINVGSILYPKTNFKRWWRVQEKQLKGTGWILSAVPSNEQPSFSS